MSHSRKDARVCGAGQWKQRAEWSVKSRKGGGGARESPLPAVCELPGLSDEGQSQSTTRLASYSLIDHRLQILAWWALVGTGWTGTGARSGALMRSDLTLEVTEVRFGLNSTTVPKSRRQIALRGG